MVLAVFHLNKEAKREIKVNLFNQTLPFCSKPKYVWVMLDRLLTYRQHIESLHKELTSYVVLLRRLAGSGWGAAATMLWIAIFALVHSTSEYCAPVWCRSAHTRLIVLIPATPWKLWLDACVHQWTTFLFLQASNLLSFVTQELHFP